MTNNDLLFKVEEFVKSYFISHPNDRLVYHNLYHTESVVKASKEIALHEGLDDNELLIVICAAWFHDIGYLVDIHNHETVGADIARKFFEENTVEESTIQAIVNCILATKLPQHPKNLLEFIVCDADLYHLGTSDFKGATRLMRKERSLLNGLHISKEEWRESTAQLMENHHYWTKFCQETLNKEKERNLVEVRSKIKDDEHEPSPEHENMVQSSDQKQDKTEHKRPDRGIESLFRVAETNNQRMSDMADNKSHILITVNSIILSAVIGLLLRSIDAHPRLAIPSYLLLTVSVITIIISIIATRPVISNGRFKQEELDNKTANLIFFGNFYKMRFEEYNAAMQNVLGDRDLLYGSLIRDVYNQGIVLARKFRLLRVAYDVFMYGLVLSVIAFIIATYV